MFFNEVSEDLLNLHTNDVIKMDFSGKCVIYADGTSAFFAYEGMKEFKNEIYCRTYLTELAPMD